MSDVQHTQVAIVGGGPVGMGLAIELGQRGVRCVVVERYPEPQHIPKGQNLTQRTMEHFHFWGAEPALRAARTIPPEYGIGGLTAYGTLLSPHHYDWLQRDLVQPYYFQRNERLPQYATEAVLRRRAAQLPAVRTLYGWQAESIGSLDDGLAVGIVQRGADSADGAGSSAERRGDGAGQVRRTLHADYVVGCDGSRSVVREQAAITQTRSDHDRMMVLLVFRSTGLHDLLARYPGKSYYNVLHPELLGYWKFFGRVDLGSTWFFHAPVPPGTTKTNFDFGRYLREAVGADFDIEFEHIGFWDLRFALADCYRAGRVFVAGDAAHSHPPYGGYGVNSGFEDARNLGWKLAAVLQGWGGNGLLDSYEAERRPVFASTMNDFISKSIADDRAFLENFDPLRDRAAFDAAWQARAAGAVGEVHAFEPHYEGSPVVVHAASAAADLRPSAVGSHRFEARAGHHLAPAGLGGDSNVFRRLDAGFTLVVVGGGGAVADVAAFKEGARALGLPLAVVDVPPQAEAMRYGARLVLVRPDHFVAWAADSLGGRTAADILNVARGQAQPGQPT